MALSSQIAAAANPRKAPVGADKLHSSVHLSMPKDTEAGEQLERRVAARQLTRMLCDHPCELDPDNGITECGHRDHDRDAAAVRELLEAVGLDDVPARSRGPSEKTCTNCGETQAIDQFIHSVPAADLTVRITSQCDTCREQRYRSRPGPTSRVPPVAAAGWMWRAACRREDPGLFFPVGEGATYAAQIGKAQRVCFGCPVRAECLELAIDEGRSGVWGGTTREERTQILRRRRYQQRKAVA